MTERQLRLIAAGPVVAATLCVAIYVGLEMLGHPIFASRPVNLAEAVANDDPATVLRLRHEGASLVDVYHVRGDVLITPAAEATPLEVAALRDRAQIIRLLERSGVVVDDQLRSHLLCIAERAASRDVLALLRSPGVVPVCGPEADRVVRAPSEGAP